MLSGQLRAYTGMPLQKKVGAMPVLTSTDAHQWDLQTPGYPACIWFSSALSNFATALLSALL